MRGLKQPPTPVSPTDTRGKEKFSRSTMESVFTLPPPAIQSENSKDATAPNQQSITNGRPSPPQSPTDEKAGSVNQRKRTLSGSNKQDLNEKIPSPKTQGSDNILPPPPPRPRKIIQMKPKTASSVPAEQQSRTTNKANSSRKESSSATTPAQKRKQAQPPTTSAAGRKIARKTAHSIIERRRRSKMNEEFGVLKDMIPSCVGVEMHKLAILQAGIEYVKYLEDCVKQLQASDNTGRPADPRSSDKQAEDELMDMDNNDIQSRSPSASPASEQSESEFSSTSTGIIGFKPTRRQAPLPSQRSLYTESATNSATASPNLGLSNSSFSPITSRKLSDQAVQYQTQPQSSTATYQTTQSISPAPLTAITPMQTGVSPALGAIRFSPDLSRTSTWTAINEQLADGKQSPHILPLPQAVVSLPFPSLPSQNGGSRTYLTQRNTNTDEGQAEATATAALIMMTQDSRGIDGTTRTSSSKGMSVKDLLSS